MAVKGFAFVLAFAFTAALLSSVATSAALAREATFFEEKFAVLELRKAAGWDVRHAWSALKASVTGDTAEKRAADMALKTGLFAAFLENEYPVTARLVPGLPNVAGLLRSAFDGKPLTCPACRFEPGFFSVLFSEKDWAAVEVLS